MTMTDEQIKRDGITSEQLKRAIYDFFGRDSRIGREYSDRRLSPPKGRKSSRTTKTSLIYGGSAVFNQGREK